MNVLLETRNLKKFFTSRDDTHEDRALIRALDGVDLVLRRTEHLGIVGESGCGKTTLAKVIMGLEPPDSGRVLFEGREVFQDRDRLRSFHRRVRMVFQDPFASLDPRFTVERILREALCLEERIRPGEEARKMKKCLHAVELPEDILTRYPHEFSGGERQRIAIARALMTDPALLILDEAVSSLDVLVQKKILDLLSGLPEKLGVTYFFIAHDLRAIRKICHKISVMYKGRIVEYGTVEDIFERAAHPYTQRLLNSALEYKIPDENEDIPIQGVLKDIGSGHLVLR
jgi:ABC-type glutathione transport system ATPase component